MKRTALLLSLTLAGGIALGVIGTQVLNAQQQSVKRTELLRRDLPDPEGYEGIVAIFEFAPGAVGVKHYHPASHNFAYVLEGAGIWESEAHPPVTRKQGDGFSEEPKEVHSAKNASTSTPLKVLVWTIAKKGQPLTVPVK